MLSSHGVSCPGCFFGAPVTHRCPGAAGIKDCRGYGPYGTGYYMQGGNDYPYGPACERLGPEYDFTPGPNGFCPRPGPPQKRLNGLGGALGMSDGTRNLLAAGGFLLAAGALAVVLMKTPVQEPRPRRRRRRFA